MTNTELTDHPDIQGLLFRAYLRLGQAGYGLFKIDDCDAFQAWLRSLLDQDQISTARHGQPEEDSAGRLNIAFTAQGLQKLLGVGWIAESFEPPFIEGMVNEHRSRLLGDVEANDPRQWRWGREQEFDGLFMTFAASRPEAEDLLAEHLRAQNGAVRVETIYGHLSPTNEEPFGFKDGISQPVIEGTRRHVRLLRERRNKEAALHGVPAGELILGYPDGTNHLPRTPAVSAARDPHGLLEPHWEWPERRDLGKNGTYLVFRQLAQDVTGFWDYIKNAATNGDGDSVDALAEKMVGRKRDGTSLEATPKTKPEENNIFDFTNDEKGLHCPIGSHVRRSNPRSTGSATAKGSLKVTLRHRILRRARLYEGPEDGEVGLNFLCFNASIARQFEFVQASWCNNQFFHGLQREVDPIIGTARPARDGVQSVDRYTIPRPSYRRLLSDIPGFVTVKGGGYFFMPGINALRCLATKI